MHPIEVSHLVVAYRRWFKPPLRAVDDLSFVVREGEIVGFLGANGAGKTSTIKTLMGFQPPTAGTVRIFGMDATDARARQLVGFLPETALYSPYLTPYETLRLYGELHGLRGRQLKAHIEALLEAVNLSHKAHTLNKNLSKGMLQRVGIAQALLGDPKLLILDEVSSGLDPIGKRELRDLLATQRARGRDHLLLVARTGGSRLHLRPHLDYPSRAAHRRTSAQRPDRARGVAGGLLHPHSASGTRYPARGGKRSMTRTLQITRALMTAGLLETLRRKDLYVVLILTLLLTLGASAFRAFGVQGLEIFVKDVALTAIGVMTTVLTVLIAARQIPEEMQRRTIYPLMARPITRGQLLLGKWATATMTASLCFVILALTTLGLLLTLGIGVKPLFVQYVLLKLLGIGWLCAMVIALSLYMTPAANVTLSLILAFGSGLFGRLLLMAHWEHDLSALWLNLLYGVLPHYDYFDMSKKVVFNWDLAPWWVLGAMAGYAVLNGGAWLLVGWLRFRKQTIG
jgi:ABC-type Na+ transport system ATPase subunit NatA/ABC-type transport system involved in multi-copper enzyme maturation permease subunit